MPFREPSVQFRDILDAINAIEEFTSGMDFNAFRQDTKTIAAVERKLQLISEAAARLGDQAEALWRLCRVRHSRHYAESQPMPSPAPPVQEPGRGAQQIVPEQLPLLDIRSA